MNPDTIAKTYGFNEDAEDTGKAAKESGTIDMPPAGRPYFKNFEVVKINGHNFQMWKQDGRQFTFRYLPPGVVTGIKEQAKAIRGK